MIEKVRAQDGEKPAQSGLGRGQADGRPSFAGFMIGLRRADDLAIECQDRMTRQSTRLDDDEIGVLETRSHGAEARGRLAFGLVNANAISAADQIGLGDAPLRIGLQDLVLAPR